MRARLVLVAVCLAAHAATAAPSETATGRARLLYLREAGAERCPDEAEARGAVTARLGYDPFGERPPLTISVILGKSVHGLRARIELLDPAGEVTGARELTSRDADCVELARAVTLAVSIAIDPLRFFDPPPPASAPASAPAPVAPPPTVTTPAKPVAAVAAAAQPERLRVRLSAGALTALGASPGVTVGFTAAAGVRRQRWSVNLEVRADLPASAAAAGGSVSTALYTGGLVPCFHQGVFAGCGLVELGAQLSRGSGYPVSASVADFYAAAGVRAALELALGRHLELLVQTDLLAPFTRTTLLADQIVVFRTAPVSGALHIALAGYVR